MLPSNSGEVKLPPTLKPVEHKPVPSCPAKLKSASIGNSAIRPVKFKEASAPTVPLTARLPFSPAKTLKCSILRLPSLKLPSKPKLCTFKLRQLKSKASAAACNLTWSSLISANNAISPLILTKSSGILGRSILIFFIEASAKKALIFSS